MNRNKVTLYNIISTIVLQGLAFISGPIFSSVLGTSNYGIASVYYTWVQIAAIVFPLQAAGAIVHARIKYPMEDQLKFQSSVLVLATASYFGFSCVTLLVCICFNLNLRMFVLGLLHGWGFYIVGAVNNKFTYEFKAGKNLILSVTTSVCTIGLSIHLISRYSQEENYWGRIYGQSLVYFVIGIVLFTCILLKGKTFVNRDYWMFALPIAVPTIFHLLANLVLNQSDKVMIQNMMSNSSAGIYSLSVTFSAVLNTIWAALNNSWVPFYYEYTRNNQISTMKKHARNYIELFTVITMGFILLSREVFHLYASKQFWEGTDLIPLFSVGVYFIFLYSFPANYEFYHKKTRIIAVISTLSALCNIVLNYIFILHYGIIGAVIATAVSHGLQFLFHYFYAKRLNCDVFPFELTDFVYGFFAVCLTIVIFFMTKDIWYIRWGLGAILGVWMIIKILNRREIF